MKIASGWTSFTYCEICIGSKPSCSDVASLAWKGAATIGTGTEAVPAFYTSVLSADAEQTGVSISGTAGTELVLVCVGHYIRF